MLQTERSTMADPGRPLHSPRTNRASRHHHLPRTVLSLGVVRVTVRWCEPWRGLPCSYPFSVAPGHETGRPHPRGSFVPTLQRSDQPRATWTFGATMIGFAAIVFHTASSVAPLRPLPRRPSPPPKAGSSAATDDARQRFRLRKHRATQADCRANGRGLTSIRQRRTCVGGAWQLEPGTPGPDPM